MTEPAGERETRNIAALTGARWYAALFVFAFHVHLFTPGWRPGRIAAVGLTGVSFFFVLSGFVLALGHEAGASTGRFYQKRFARVWPTHFATWLIALLFLRQLGQTFQPLAAAMNLLLIEGWFPHRVQFVMDPPSWSLCCEAAFYLAFPQIWRVIEHLSLPRADVLVGTWLLGAAVTAFVMVPRVEDVVVYSSPLLRGSEFALGVLLARHFREGQRLRGGAWVVAILLGALALDEAVPGYARRGWLVVLPFGASILWIASNPSSTAYRFLAHRWNVYLGELSFAFYLVHQLVVQPRAPQGTVAVVQGLRFAILSLLLATLGAAALHHGVERPGQRSLSRRREGLDRRGRAPVRPPGS